LGRKFRPLLWQMTLAPAAEDQLVVTKELISAVPSVYLHGCDDCESWLGIDDQLGRRSMVQATAGGLHPIGGALPQLIHRTAADPRDAERGKRRTTGNPTRQITWDFLDGAASSSNVHATTSHTDGSSRGDPTDLFEDEDDYTGRPLEAAMVRRAEELLGVALPPAYLDLLYRRNGGVPKRRCFPTAFRTSWAPDHMQISAFRGSVGDGELTQRPVMTR